ncbi:MAG: GAF domain-containing protein [Chloroflexota bacterium]|nr:GAF domain-containing protein [Chloroflexota bacterium]
MLKNAASLLNEIRSIVSTDQSRDYRLTAICQLLVSKVEHYDWVGFYLVVEEALVLGPFVGAPTEHTHINFGEGVCGQVAESEAVFIVQDVTQTANYLSCSPRVKSEIVIPLHDRNQVLVGELDIDSYQLAPFTKCDQGFLEEVCQNVAALF